MPHSGGGGSHSGGSYHSGGGHRGSSGRPSGVQRASYPGAHRYVIYNSVTHIPEYYFSDKEPKETIKEMRFNSIIFIVMGALFTICGICILCLFGFVNPAKVSCRMSGYRINDEAGILNNTGVLEENLKLFYDKTGIYTVFLTVNNETWINNFNSLEAYAYDRYIIDMPDEKCWLIVYSEPVNKDTSFVDWHWETMVGDDLDKILNQKILDKFNKNFNDSLILTDAQNPANSLAGALGIILPKLMKTYVNGDIPLCGGILALLGIFFMISGIFTKSDSKKYNNAIPMPKDADSADIFKEAHCEYCNIIYAVGTIYLCPNCGAPVKTLEDFRN